jgi:plasmid stabilization system protein ParE
VTRLRITGAAEQDLLDGFAFYEKQQTGIGAYFIDSLSADIDALQLYAGIHAKPHGRFHRTLAKRFPFAVYYDFEDDVVTVVAVLDCRRDPASITRRLGVS